MVIHHASDAENERSSTSPAHHTLRSSPLRRWLIVQEAGHYAGSCDLTRTDRRIRNQRRAVASVGRCKPREVVYHIKWAQSILRAPRKQQEGKPAREEIDLRANGRSIHTLTSCAGSVEAIWKSNRKPATTIVDRGSMPSAGPI